MLHITKYSGSGILSSPVKADKNQSTGQTPKEVYPVLFPSIAIGVSQWVKKYRPNKSAKNIKKKS